MARLHRHRSGRRLAAALVLAMATGLSGCGGGTGTEPALQVGDEVALLDHLEEAAWDPIIINLNNPVLGRVTTDLGDGPVAALYAHPPAAVTWTLLLEHPVDLVTAAGLDPRAWQRSHDGAGFRVLVDGREVKGLRLQPRQDPAHRGWQTLRVDLSSWTGRRIRLTLATDRGPALDPAFDWALWREPRLVRR